MVLSDSANFDKAVKALKQASISLDGDQNLVVEEGNKGRDAND